MKIISHRHRETTVNRFRSFSDTTSQGVGWEFPVDEDGNIVVNDVNRANVELCLSGADHIVDEGIKTYEHYHTVPAKGICDCGTEVWLGWFTNTCEGCGRDYNSSGQQLAPRSQWGEETQESLSDILRIR